jgi:hypothetical protein
MDRSKECSDGQSQTTLNVASRAAVYGDVETDTPISQDNEPRSGLVYFCGGGGNDIARTTEIDRLVCTRTGRERSAGFTTITK